MLVASLTPSAAAYGETNDYSQNNESGAAGLSEKSQAKDYYYMSADSSWLVVVSTAGDMPADAMAGGTASAVFTPLAGDELSAAESAAAAKWDGDLSGRVTAGRVSLSEGSIPADAKVTATSLGRSANDSWAGYSLAGGELSPNGSFGMNDLAQMNGWAFELDGSSASDPVVLVRTTGLSEKSQAKDYYYMSADSSWLVVVSTAGDMPADAMAGGTASAVFTPLAGDELSAAESAAAAKWDGDLSGRVTAGRVSLSEGSIPADAKVTATSLGRSANDSWAGYSLAGGELSPNGSFGMNDLAQMNGWAFELDGSSASDPVVLVRTTGLSEISAEKQQYIYTDINGAWAVEIRTGSSAMPKDALSQDPSMAFAEFVSASDEQEEQIEKALAALYSGDLSFEAGTLKIRGLTSLPHDAEVSIWRMGCSSNKAWKGFTFSDGKVTQAGGAGTYFETSSYSFGLATLDDTLVLLDATNLTEQLQPGTYTVTANPYIPGSDNVVLEGVSVYLASPAFPPTMPASNNATLTVAEDGTKYLTIKFDNTAGDIFTQQNIESGDGVEVVEAHRNDTRYEGPDGKTYAEGRIDRLELKLLNDSGEYSFSNCKQFPTIIGTFTEMQVRLSVDFSSAVRAYTPDGGSDDQAFSAAFSDEATGASVEVTSTDAATVAELKRAGVKLVVSKNGDAYDSMQQKLATSYTSPLDFDLYDIAFVSPEGYEIDLNGNTKVAISLPTGAASIADTYSVEGSSLKQVSENASVKDGKVSVEWSTTGSFAVVDKDKASKWYSRTLVNSTTGLAWQMALTDVKSKYQSGTVVAHPEKLLGQATSFEVSSASNADREAAIEAVKQTYSGTFNDSSSIAACFSEDSGVAHAPNAVWNEGGNSCRTLHVPSSYCSLDGLQAFYIKKSGSTYEATLLSVSMSDGEAVVDVFPETMTEDQARARSQELFNGRFPDDAVSKDSGFVLLAPGSSVTQTEKTYESNDVTLALKSSRSAVIDKMEGAKLVVTTFATDSAEAQALRSQFASSMSIDPSFVLMGIEIDDGAGNPLSVSSEDGMNLSLPVEGMKDPVLYLWDGSNIQEVSSTYENGTLSAAISTFGAYVVVDNATAIEKEYDQTFVDSATGARVRVTTKNPLLGVKLDSLASAGSALHVEKSSDDSDAYAAVKSALGKEYEEAPDFQVMSLSLVDGDAAVDLKNATSVTVSFATTSAKPALFEVANSKLSKLDSSFDSGVVSANVKSLGMYALVDAEGATEREWVTKEFTDEESGATVKLVTRESGIVDRLDGAKLTATLLSENDEAYKPIAKYLEDTYYKVGKGTTAYTINLLDAQGNSIDPTDEETEITVVKLPLSSDYEGFGDDYLVWNGQVLSSDAKEHGKNADGSWYLGAMKLSHFGTVFTVASNGSQKFLNVCVPEGKSLKFTGEKQTGIEQNRGCYVIDGDINGVAEATEPGKYSNELTLRADHMRWVDENGMVLEGNPRAITVNWEIVDDSSSTTYSVTANLSMPGEYNPVLSGVTVYVNNPNNPFTDKAGNSPVLDGGSAEGVQNTAPTTPMADNATITVAPDGTKTLTLNLPNPVFTLQDLGTCEALPNVKVETKEPADKSVWDYGKYDTRICRVTVTLPADANTTGVQTYTFTGSKLYAVPINADIQPEAGKPALNLTIDYSTVKTSKAVDASALASAVADAKKLAEGATVSVDGSDVSTEGTWVTKEALQSFNDAIAKASTVADSNLLSQQMVTDATEALQAAVDTFKAAAKPGTKDDSKPEPQISFSDVTNPDDWYYKSVYAAARLGYMNGYWGTDLFGPGDKLTRGQAACVLGNMANCGAGETPWAGEFSDVAAGDYFAASVAWAKAAGVVYGYQGTDLFGPGDELTREQMACMLYNYAKNVDGADVSVADVDAELSRFDDAGDVSSWARDAVAWATSRGVMGNGGFINAGGAITRAEMAAMAVNFQPEAKPAS